MGTESHSSNAASAGSAASVLGAGLIRNALRSCKTFVLQHLDSLGANTKRVIANTCLNYFSLLLQYGHAAMLENTGC